MITYYFYFFVFEKDFYTDMYFFSYDKVYINNISYIL